MNAIVFPGQGSQFTGMGGELLQEHPDTLEPLFAQAAEVLGYDLQEVMLKGPDSRLKETRITQPAVFVHSYAAWSVYPEQETARMAAGHSLGELSAMAASGALSFADALRLVHIRASGMQEACEAAPSTMAAVMGLDDEQVSQACAQIEDEVVVAANFNAPGQVVISGTHEGVRRAGEAAQAAGAKRVVALPVGGAFHSPLMQPARERLEIAVRELHFEAPRFPIYQNVSAEPVTQPRQLQQNLIEQLTSPVCWSQTVRRMQQDGATQFIEIGPGKVLSGLVKKLAKGVAIHHFG
jgi:[acyl-carrier-protein] S-malonyltransferase